MNMHPVIKSLIKVDTLTGLVFGVLVGIVGYIVVLTLLSKSGGNNVEERQTTVALRELENESRIPPNTLGLLGNDDSNLDITNLIHQVDLLDLDLIVQAIHGLALVPSDSTIEMAQDILLQALSVEDPKQALENVWRFPSFRWSSLIRIVFEEWSTQSLSDSMRAASNIAGPLKAVALSTILDQQYDLDISEYRVLEFASEFGVRGHVHRLNREYEANKLLEQPQAAWSFIVEDRNFTSLRQHKEILIEIAESWIQQDGFNVLGHVYDDIYPNNFILCRQILESVAADEPQRALESVLNSSKSDTALTAWVVHTWGSRDPLVAFQATLNIENRSVRQSAMESLFIVWAERNPRELLEQIPLLPKSIRSSAVRFAIGTLVVEDTTAAVETMHELSSVTGAINSEVLLSLVRSWAKVDSGAAVEWVRNNSEEDGRKFNRLILEILSTHARTDPDGAMSLALTLNPPKSKNFQYETKVIETISRFGDVDKAIKLLDRVRKDARMKSMVTVGQTLITSSRLEDAIALAERITSEEQIDYFTQISSSWNVEELFRLVEWIEKLPSAQAKSSVARRLMEYYGPDGWLGSRLTSSQVEQLKTFLSGNDEKESTN